MEMYLCKIDIVFMLHLDDMTNMINYLLFFFQIWFFSDSDDPSVVKKTNGHLVNTKCSSSHNRSALCCKMAAEIMAFLATDNR